MDKQEEKNKGFIGTTLGVCYGTEIFSKLINTPYSKALIHFIVLAFIAASAYVAIKTPGILNSTVNYCNALYKYFGGVNFSNDGLMPLKNPEKLRVIKIGKLKIDYLPQADIEHKMDDAGAEKGIIWLPRALFIWLKTSSGYQYIPVLSSTKKINTSKLSAANLDTILAIARKDNFDPETYNVRQTFSFTDAKIAVFLVAIALYFAAMFFSIALYIPIYSLIILAIFTFFGSRILEKVKATNLFAVILYSSFPGIIISTIYSALSLPFFDFKTLAFLCLIIYLFFVINSLQKKLYPQKQEDDNYDDDIF